MRSQTWQETRDRHSQRIVFVVSTQELFVVQDEYYAQHRTLVCIKQRIVNVTPTDTWTLATPTVVPADEEAKSDVLEEVK